ncbi:hypothetical protein Sjap_026149 [Stephania japonica]|uniref:Uncharacterized protein n=1 Tax=Stephania japonica TaxID=461633 RepID=A0AAP0HET3_9MAGN
MRVQLNDLSARMAELSVGMVKLLGIHRILVPDYRRNPIICEETKGDSFFSEEDKFEDKEEQVNFDEAPKVYVGDKDFIEDRLVFRDDGHVIEVILQSASPRVLDIVDDGVVNNYLIEKGVETK